MNFEPKKKAKQYRYAANPKTKKMAVQCSNPEPKKSVQSWYAWYPERKKSVVQSRYVSDPDTKKKAVQSRCATNHEPEKRAVQSKYAANPKPKKKALQSRYAFYPKTKKKAVQSRYVSNPQPKKEAMKGWYTHTKFCCLQRPKSKYYASAMCRRAVQHALQRSRENAKNEGLIFPEQAKSRHERSEAQSGA